MSNPNTSAKNRELSESDMDQVAGGLSVGTFEVRGGTTSGGNLQKIHDGEEVLSEFVPSYATR